MNSPSTVKSALLAALLILAPAAAFGNSADSTNIRVDTRGRNLVSLDVLPMPDLPPIPPLPPPPFSAPMFSPPPGDEQSITPPAALNTVISGGVKQFRAMAIYDDGSWEDVTDQATWSLGANTLRLTSLVNGLLSVGTTGVSVAGQVSAAFIAGTGSARGICNFIVLPGTQIEASGVVSVGLQISATAWVVGNQQAVSAGDILWDLDNDESYGESGEIGSLVTREDGAVGSLVTKQVTDKKNYLLRVKALIDGKMIYRSFIVEVNMNPLQGAPVTLPVQDITVGGLKIWNGSSLAIGGLQTGRTGLAVVIHGLEDSTDSSWVGELCGAIQGAVSNANVTAWDWRLMADPTLYANGTTVPNDVKGLAQVTAGGDLFLDLLTIRQNGKTNGILLAERLLAEFDARRITQSTPIHLIGHSAGGFAAGECAKRLETAGFSNLQVTMLDTPIPFKSHVNIVPRAGSVLRTERYITGFFGGRFETDSTKPRIFADLYNLGASWMGDKIEHISYVRTASVQVVGSLAVLSAAFPPASGYTVRQASGISQGSNYRRVEIQNPGLPSGDMNRHSYAYQWYKASVNQTMLGGEGGFGYYSNLLGPTPFPSSASAILAPMMAKTPQTQAISPPPIDVGGFTYFGTASGAAGVHTLTENTDAGFWKTMTMPTGSETLRFRYRFTSAGDGDFVAAYWGEETVLVICPDTESARTGFVEMEADVSRFGGQTGNLVFKLVSRGEVNAVAQIDQVQIVLSDDPDDDGLTNAQEATYGSNPHNDDSDGDGLSDSDEVTTHGTNPALADSDGDMVPDQAELAASTNPLNKNSFLRPRMERGAGGQLELRWQGVNGRTYSVVRSLDLSGTAFDFIRTEVPGAGVDCSVIDPGTSVNPRAFYWVVPE